MEQSQHPNWIAERAKCNLTLLWNDLVPLLITDTKRRRQEAVAEQSPIRYVIDQNAERSSVSRVHILRYRDTEQSRVIGSCWFISKGECIRVNMEKPDGTGAIYTRWDAEKSQCYVAASRPSDGQKEEFPHDELWKVLQFILEPFFFPQETDLPET